METQAGWHGWQWHFFSPTLLESAPVLGWLFFQWRSLAFKNWVIFHKKIDYGPPGRQGRAAPPHTHTQGGRRGRLDGTSHWCFGFRNRETFHALNSLKPSLDFLGKNTPVPAHSFQVSARKWRSPSFFNHISYRLSMKPALADFLLPICVWPD